MLVMYIRSSMLGALEFCEQKCYINYVLGMKDKQNRKASLGNVTHKALELLARKSLAISLGHKKVDCEDFGIHPLKKIDVETATKWAFDYYSKSDTDNTFNEKDLKQCTEWTYKAIEMNDGQFNPLKSNIFKVEEFFDIEIPHKWAKYSYDIGGENISGNLKIKGTVDLICQESDNYYLILDYKTGKRLNWGTGEVKEDFQKDPQLLLYYWALKNKYPDKSFYLTILYINDGGPYSVVFDEYDYELAENMIRQKFEYIKSLKHPKLLSQDNSHWKCKYLCGYSARYGDSSKSICQHIRDEIKVKGINEVTEEYGDLSKLGSYGDGGGRLVK